MGASSILMDTALIKTAMMASEGSTTKTATMSPPRRQSKSIKTEGALCSRNTPKKRLNSQKETMMKTGFISWRKVNLGTAKGPKSRMEAILTL